MIKNIPTHLELKYKPTIGWYVNVKEMYPPDMVNGWLQNVAYPFMKKRISQLPTGDLKEQMTKVLPDLFNCKVSQLVNDKFGLDVYKSNQKVTSTTYHYN